MKKFKLIIDIGKNQYAYHNTIETIIHLNNAATGVKKRADSLYKYLKRRQKVSFWERDCRAQLIGVNHMYYSSFQVTIGKKIPPPDYSISPLQAFINALKSKEEIK